MTYTPTEVEPDNASWRDRFGPTTRTSRVVFPLVGVALLLTVWELTVYVNDLEPIVMPRPLEVVQSLGDLLMSSDFWEDVRVSLVEFGTGYVLGVVFGVLVGVLMAEFRPFQMMATPIIESFRFIVPFAWIPLVVLWFGTDLIGKTLLVAYATFFVMVVSTTKSVEQLDPTFSRVGTMLGMSRWRLAFTVHLRAAAPTIASAARAAAAIAWIAVVAAEYIGASAGLGVLIINAATSLETDVVIAGMVVIGLVGAGVSALISWVSRAYLSYL